MKRNNPYLGYPTPQRLSILFWIIKLCEKNMDMKVEGFHEYMEALLL